MIKTARPLRLSKKQVSDDLQRRYNMNETEKLCNSLPIVCTFLDPRYRSLPFLTEAQRAIVHEHILSILQNASSSTENTTNPDSSTASEPHIMTDVTDADSSNQNNQDFSCKRSKLSQDDVSFLLGGYFDTQDCEVVLPSTTKEELDMYAKERPVSTKINPFDWWKVNSANFPKLAMLARRVLCSPATSVPSERVFSTAGGTVTKLRATLDSESIDKLIFVNKRLKFLANQKTGSAKTSVAKVAIKAEPKSPIKIEQRDEANQSNNKVLPPLPQLPDLPFSLWMITLEEDWDWGLLIIETHQAIMLLNVWANCKDSDQSANLSSLAENSSCAVDSLGPSWCEQTAQTPIRFAGLSL